MLMEARRDVFQAIADPTRREIIHLIAQHPRNLNTIADNFTITRQAISLHIKILMECGLVEIMQHGRERYCTMKAEKLGEVQQWLSQYTILWTKKLSDLKTAVENGNDRLIKPKIHKKSSLTKKLRQK
jgi:DNA-binding transcriptional ArsR family regulator